MTQELQDKILSIGREMSRAGLVAGTWGNISAWDDELEGFWITPSGMEYMTMKTGDLVLLDAEGKVRHGERKPSSEYILHKVIYQNRTDVKAIVHTHSAYATAHAAARVPLPALVEDIAQVAGSPICVAVYHTPGSRELAAAAVSALGDRNAVLLANHGLVGVGADLDEALKVCNVVEKGAQIHVMSKLLGGPVFLDDKDVRQMRTNYLNYYGQK